MFNQVICSSIPNFPVHISQTCKEIAGHLSHNHFHDEIELLAVTKGEILCESGDISTTISAGDILFINSRIQHKTAALKNGTTSVLVQIDMYALSHTDISKYLTRFVNNGDNQMVLFAAEDPATEELMSYMNTLCRELEKRSSAYEAYIRAKVYNVLAFLYRHNALVDADSFFDMKNTDKILPALSYIDSHFGENITLEEISGVVNLNPSYFCRCFKKATNSTFKEYLNFVRICRAEKLLFATSKSILEISLETGFSSLSYFTTAFKRAKNCTPTVYRKIKYAQK